MSRDVDSNVTPSAAYPMPMPMPMPDYSFGEPLSHLPTDVVLPEISVKNTFICCDDLPPEMDLQRSVTDSCTLSRGGPLGHQGNPLDYPQAPLPIPEQNEHEAIFEDDSPPTPMAMTRAITQECVENQYEWSWAFDRDAGAAGPPMPQPEQQQQQFMMMQPMQGMQMMPGNGPDQPQMAVYMVPMRGVRWPDEAPGSAQPQVVPPVGPPNAGTPNQNVPAPIGNSAKAGSSTGGYGGNNAGSSSVAKREAPKYTVTEEPPALQPLTRAFSVGSGAFRINWTLSATKLRSADKNAVSPAFELSFGGAYSSTKFKLMLLPQVSSEGKGGSTFRKSDGKGYILLKCEADLQEGCGNLRFRLFVGSQAPRGPVTHDFSQSAVKGLPKELETWDLNSSVKNGYVVLGAEIIPICG
eukprot:gnl/MRDRNA2_/MRDRNA2_117336_c0_seq1.p1 gnl/MRDRNA2_/MRDRNA2_117336_c0~~gnl/MRDRNA2_/MRDRNA2_117336_c0_seq1.p1  ORF type:complete len:437 (+),score=76.35 gnl/MRDRNA2_/MRDRNA2_117336_c0_seq1:83-1312(+)